MCKRKTISYNSHIFGKPLSIGNILNKLEVEFIFQLLNIAKLAFLQTQSKIVEIWIYFSIDIVNFGIFQQTGNILLTF